MSAQALPDYLVALEPLTADLRAIHGDDWDWHSGGCFAFADAYTELFGGECWGICSFDSDTGDYPVEHAIVKVANGLYVDARGVVDVTALQPKQHLKAKIDHEIYWFDDEFLSDAQMVQLREALSAAGAIATKRPKLTPSASR